MQTYILELIDGRGVIVDFHRFGCKRQSTCIKQFSKCCNGTFAKLFVDAVKKSEKLALFSTDADGSNERLVWSMGADEFLDAYIKEAA